MRERLAANQAAAEATAEVAAGGGGSAGGAALAELGVDEARTMSASELLSHVDALKTAATARFSSGEHERACAQYEQAQRLLNVLPAGLSEAEAKRLHTLKLALHLNRAACELRATRHEGALAQCDAALELSPGSTKALFRRAQALGGLGRLTEAIEAYIQVLAIEPTSRQAHEGLRGVRERLAAAQGQGQGQSGGA